jgi:hypothetical protein
MSGPTAVTSKAEALALFEAEYTGTESRIRTLSAEQLERPIFGEGEGWRVKDLPAHWALWQRLAGRAAERIAAGTPWPAEWVGLRPFLGIETSLDDLNAERFAQFRDRSFQERLAELRSAHRALMDALERLPEDAILDPAGPEGIRRPFFVPGINHLRLHREHLEAALIEGATTT